MYVKEIHYLKNLLPSFRTTPLSILEAVVETSSFLRSQSTPDGALEGQT